MAHLAESDFEALFAGRLEPARTRAAVKHLAGGCAACLGRLLAAIPPDMMMPPRAAADQGDAYDAAIDRAWRAARPLVPRWKEDCAQIERGLALIRAHPDGETGLTWGQRQSIRGWKHVEVLLALSFEARHRDPADMLQLAECAQEVADRLPPPAYGAAFLLDLRARAWAELGNARRVNERFSRANAALEQARSLFEQGTGDRMVEARIDEIEASLRKALRQLDAAHGLLDRVHRAWLDLGDRHLAGRALVLKGLTLIIGSEPAAAARFLRQAVDMLDAGRDPQLLAAAYHDLLWALVEAGRFAEAGRVLFKHDLRRAFADDPLSVLRLRWVETKLLAARGRCADAEGVFREVRAGFVDRGLEYVAAMVGMDLAAVLLRQEKKDEARDLAWEMHQAFRRSEVDPQAVLAVRTFEAACRMKVATAPMAERVGGFLGQLQRSPGLRFDAASMVAG